MQDQLLLNMQLRLTHLTDQLDAHMEDGESPLRLMVQIEELVRILNGENA